MQIYPLTGIPEVRQHHDLAQLLRAALERQALTFCDGDVLVVSSKVVSKAEALRAFGVGGRGEGSGGSENGVGPLRHEVIEAHSVRVVAERATPGGKTQIVASAAGPVMAAAGVDDSNTGPDGGSLMLPSDPDLVARNLYAGLLRTYAPTSLPMIGIVISDTAGRPWREGQTDFALGACGVQVLQDLRGGVDVDGRPLVATARAVADEIAAAADLVKGKTLGIPAALVRGLPTGTVGSPGLVGSQALLRQIDSDWFTLGTAESVRAALGAPPGSAAAEQVGIPATGPEGEQARFDRARALTVLGVSESVDATAIGRHEAQVWVDVADPYLRGVVVTRLQVALHGEGLGSWEITPLTATAGVSVDSSGDSVEDD
ncbi:MAG: coenzyme F420-0:L-glutamate ligase [Ornithinimicrobium sp.]